ncbi:hypothetical protein GRS96_02505 [Rathayibacter sp. VKM Ac-2803]|nr:hypothetical protein [Rathayibacter sp. VKM Ac-2803]MWV59361.1 hypothetical protein [Rathayibacter sp. VKM Ac-2754]
MHPDPERMAALAIDVAHHRLENPYGDTWTHTVPASLIVRGSTRAVSG